MSEKTRISLESLASDLKRVSVGLQRGSFGMAQRFSEEALRRKNEVSPEAVKPYISRILTRLETTLTQDDPNRAAEDALTYSIIIQNYCQKNGTK
jgi:hypothetical protein